MSDIVERIKDAENATHALFNHIFQDAREEIERLRAKIEQMERQEPIAWTTKLALELGSSALGFDACRGNLWGEKVVPLYALPGAQPAPSVPEGWQLVPIEPTTEMLRAANEEWEGKPTAMIWADMLAAAPKPEGE